MPFHLTGHHEIDYQHSLLDGLSERLDRFCPLNEGKAALSCGACPSHKRLHCVDTLAQLTGEILAFLVGHATYEESLMALLPRTPQCARHIKGHTQSHREVLARLNKISAAGDNVSPLTRSERLHQALRDWMAPHTSEFDSRLTDSLLESAQSETTYDGQLVHILDEFVFHHRPTRLKFQLPPAESPAQLSVRASLDSLTPRQREVCQLMALGKSNKAIAESLGTTVNTIKTHRTLVFRKMGVSSALDLARKIDHVRSGQRDKLAPDASRGQKAKVSATSKMHSLRILVIEQSRSLRGSIVAGLNALGHKAFGTSRTNCTDWLDRSTRPDLILVGADPTGSATEMAGLLVRLKEACACPVLVAEPAGAGSTSRRRRLKADGHLAWPLDFGELSAAVGRFARHST